MENQEKRWQTAEENLAEIERLKRQEESLERERRVLAGTAERGKVKKEESGGKALDIETARERLMRARSRMSGEEQETEGDDGASAKNIDSAVEEMEEHLTEKLGALPKKRVYISDKEFPRGGAKTDEWAMASFREKEFRKEMRKYLALK